MQSPRVGAVFRGRYLLEGLLGRGGMGSVWKARDRQLGRDVALKFMAGRLEGSRIARKRFDREAKLTAKLRSRHVVRVLDHGVEGSTPFIAMELLEGEDLAARIQRKGPLPLDEATRLVSDICRGLRRAHEAGLVHRDLKPANVFVTRDETGTEVVKILDFGVVKTISATFEASVATESGAIVGSVHYASPEQAEGQRDLDARSDVWSVAALAFRLITGQLPFGGEALGAVVMAICSRPVPRVSDVAPHLPRALDAVFLRAFERDRDRRFQTALEFADAFLEATGVAEVAPLSRPLGRTSHLDTFEDAPTRMADAQSTRVVDLTAAASATRDVADAPPPPPALASEADATRRMDVPAGLSATADPVATSSPAGGTLRPTASRRTVLLVAASIAAVLAIAIMTAGIGDEPRPRAVDHGQDDGADQARADGADRAAAVAAPPASVEAAGDRTVDPPPTTAVDEAAPAISASAAAEPSAADGTARPPRRSSPSRCKDAKGRVVPCGAMYSPERP